MKYISWIFALLLLVSCREASQQEIELVDSLNQKAYNIRYTDIDSTRYLARKAFEAAENYPDGQSMALNMLAYVDYQQMNFAAAFSKLDSVELISNNQINHLVSDVLRMKINQRIGDGSAYFEARVSAENHLKRAEEEFKQLSLRDLANYYFARSEYHIVSSTYCYYQGQTKQAIDEMDAIADDFIVVSDTTQWLYYHYMMGSGGLIEGEPDEVACQEFDHLMICWGFSRTMNITYFAANSLQALASLLSDPERRQLIKEYSIDLYGLLLSQHKDWLVVEDEDVEEHFAEALALHSVYLFRQYKDLFQTACAYRTLGEMSFKHGHYEDALYNYSMALDCVNEQYVFNTQHNFNQKEDSHDAYVFNSENLLSLYAPAGAPNAEIELSWIKSDSIYTVPEWIAGIRQQISMAYSALGMKQESDYNRDIYLDIIASTSQNVEMESRMIQLKQEASALRLRLLLTFLLLIVLLGLIFFYSHRLRKNNDLVLKEQRLQSAEQAALQEDSNHILELEDENETLNELVNLSRIKIDTNKRQNVEKRAKVSLVHAVTPFLDRIINQVDRMNRNGRVEEDKLNYIIELTDRIVNYNDILTDWIKMVKGEVLLQISTVQLNKIFQTLQKGHYAFDQKGVKLQVEDTDLVVKADEALTLFMLNTLADNARKFTPEGGTVSVKAIGGEDYVELSVTDTGCGMSQEDVDTLNNNKVYDSRRIGQSQDGKGFGFGIMNCRGIIENYRKTSVIFQKCTFGVESKLGEGTRFFFRLPRVLTMLVLFLFCTITFAQDSMNDSLAKVKYIEQKYESLKAISPHFVLTSAEQDSLSNTTTEIDLFLRGDSLNYPSIIQLRNDIARTALELKWWDVYHYNNTLCISLYKLYHQDRLLPTYCEKLQRTQTASRQLLVLLVLFSLLLVVLSLLILRRRVYLGKGLQLQQQLCTQLEKVDVEVKPTDIGALHRIAKDLLVTTYEGMNKWSHLEGIQIILQTEDGISILSTLYGSVSEYEKIHTIDRNNGYIKVYYSGKDYSVSIDNHVIRQLQQILIFRVLKPYVLLTQKEVYEDELKHLHYEEHRLHVQNQVLDNCLSTIKHESMYYPSRIHQLSQRILDKLDCPVENVEDLQQLTELVYYYKEVYNLLSGQAEKLTQQICYRKEKINIKPILEKAQHNFNKQSRKLHLDIQLELQDLMDNYVNADEVLLEEMTNRFNAFILKRYSELQDYNETYQPTISILREQGELKLCYQLPGIVISDAEAHSLFYPESGHVQLLVAKQIVRELDTLNNFPGLRLIAESKENQTNIWIHLK